MVLQAMESYSVEGTWKGSQPCLGMRKEVFFRTQGYYY